MSIQYFAARFGGSPRPIRSVMEEWQLGELKSLVDTAMTQASGIAATIDDRVGDAVVIGDIFRGTTLVDSLPKELRDAFVALMDVDRRDLSRMREILVSHIGHDGGGYLPFDDPRVMGFVNKIKGQIGENLFSKSVGDAATLALSGSQEGWDVAIRQADGSHEYVQVKLYQSASGVVQHMKDVQQKILEGKLEGVSQEKLSKVFFAVPDDIHEDVRRLAARHEGLSAMVYDKSIPISSTDAAKMVHEGLSNVGPDQLMHFFGQLLQGAVIAGSLHGVVNGFLWYQGSKEFSRAVGDTAADTAVSTLGIGIALLAERAIDTAMVAGGIGMIARMFLKRAAKSRWDFADFLEASTGDTRSHLATLGRVG